MICDAVATTVHLRAGRRLDVVDREHVRRIGHRHEEATVFERDGMAW